MDYDIIIIGAGIIGLSIAYSLSKRNLKCLVIEKNNSFGMETSSRNSEVIHSGIYYKNNSLKAILCVKGNRLLYDYCKYNSVPYNKIGKYIISNNLDEDIELNNIKNNALNNEVENIDFVSISDFKNLEPNINASSALQAKETGIINSHLLMESLYRNSISFGCDFAFKHCFISTSKINELYNCSIRYDNKDIFEVKTKYIINCSGLNSDITAQNCGIDINKEKYNLYYTKGNYFRVNNYPNICNKLIYPVPPIDKQSLGIHLTIELGGGFKLGPDTEIIDKTLNYSVDENLKEKFYKSASKYIRNLELEMLSPDQSGIRPKIKKFDGDFQDFIISEESNKGFKNLINLIGIESPGLTSSLAIAEYVSNLVE